MIKKILSSAVLVLVVFKFVFGQIPSVPKPETPKPEEPIRLQTIEPFYYCAIEMKGSYEQHSAAFETLYGQAATLGFTPDVPFGVYYNNPQDTPVEQLQWEIGFAVPEKKDVKTPLVLKEWEYTTLVTAQYDGPYNSPDMQKLYGAIFAWMGKNGYASAGPMMEKFLSMPEPTADGGYRGKVEILLPVQKQAGK